MIDKPKLSDKLTEGLLQREMMTMNPSMFIPTNEECIKAYRTDQVMNNRVRSLVSCIMDLVEQCDVSDVDPLLNRTCEWWSVGAGLSPSCEAVSATPWSVGAAPNYCPYCGGKIVEVSD